MMIDLASLDNSETKLFLNSFDIILSDCDGVLWSLSTAFLGVKDTLDKLKELGKEIRFVTNNNSYSKAELFQKIKNCYSYVQSEDILFPTIPIISYLKKIDFNKEIFCLGFSTMKEELVKAGFKLAKLPPPQIPTDSSCANYFQDNKEVGAVIFDFDLNLNFTSIQNAMTYLQRPDVLFITGVTGRWISMSPTITLPGMPHFIKILEEFTDRKAMCFGKPSAHLNKFIIEEYKIKDPSRVLFIGDDLEADIGFASECGYQKLLVLSGVTRSEDVKNCKNRKLIPDYCVDNLSDLIDLIAKIEEN